MSIRRAGLVLLCLTLLAPAAVYGQPERDTQETQATQEINDRLIAFSGRLRLSLSIASFAIYAPSLADLHLHAQQIVNALEGSQGDHFVNQQEQNEAFRGLRDDVTDLIAGFGDNAIDDESKVRMVAATRNITLYLEMALRSALSALNQRRLDAASEEMLRVYAYLAAAYERPSETARVPGLWTILRQFGLVDGAFSEDA